MYNNFFPALESGPLPQGTRGLYYLIKCSVSSYSMPVRVNEEETS